LKTSWPFMNRLANVPSLDAPSPSGLLLCPVNAQLRCFWPLPSARGQRRPRHLFS
jgi:hypothetical protein